MKWQTLDGPRHTYSAIARNSDGRLELFALTDDGSLQHSWQTSSSDPASWSEWHPLGRGQWDEGGPDSFTVALDKDGCLQLFLVADGAAPDARGQIFQNGQRSPGPAGTTSEPRAPGVGADEWTGWHTLDARFTHGWSTTVGTTVVRGADGLLNLFVMSANRGVLEEKWWSDYTNSTMIGHYRQTERGQWNGPELRTSVETCIDIEGRSDYTCTSKLPVQLAAALNNDGRLELFANAGDLEAKRRGVPGITYIPAYLWHVRQSGNHSRNWGSSDFPMPPAPPAVAGVDMVDTHYGARATQPSVVLNHEGNLEVYVWGNIDHGIWVKKQDPAVEGRWLPWVNIGGAGGWRRPVVVGDGNNLLTVLASNMNSNEIWYLTQDVDSEGRAVWPAEWHPITEDGDGDEQGRELLHAIINQDGRIELFASGSARMGFSYKYQNKQGE